MNATTMTETFGRWEVAYMPESEDDQTPWAVGVEDDEAPGLYVEAWHQTLAEAIEDAVDRQREDEAEERETLIQALRDEISMRLDDCDDADRLTAILTLLRRK